MANYHRLWMIIYVPFWLLRIWIWTKEIPASWVSVQFSHPVTSDSFRRHELQHVRLPCLLPTPEACSNSCPLSWWCHPTVSSSVVPSSSHLQSFLAPGSFSNESVLRIRWPKYCNFSFSINPSNEHPGLISFRMDCFDPLAFQGTLKSLLQHHSSKASFLLHSELSLWSNSHIYIWLLEKPQLWLYRHLSVK